MRAWPKSLLAAVTLLAGCGYVADPQPPALRIPARVTDLSVSQHQDRVRIRFTVPELTTDGLALRLGKVDLRGGPHAESAFEAEPWAAQARVLDTAALKPGPAEVTVPSAWWTGQEVLFQVRIVNDRGRAGEWSDPVVLRVVPPLETPSGLSAEAVGEGVRLSWTGPEQPPGLVFRILRRTEKQDSDEELATVDGREWIDRATRYGESYTYSLVAIVNAGNARAESAASRAVTIRPEDRFPPAVPGGMVALAGPSSIELTWDPNPEADLAGYYLYRSVEGGEFARVGGLLSMPGYSDKEVRAGATYRYAVSSVDQAGNESGRSPAVEAVLR